MAGTKKRSGTPLSIDPLPFKKLRYITAAGDEEINRESTHEERLSTLLAGLPCQANGASPLFSEAGGRSAPGVVEASRSQQWTELGEQLASAQEELNIMLDVIQQVEAGKLVTVENVPRPKPTLTEHKEDVAKRVGVKHAAMQGAHTRLREVTQRIQKRVETAQTFYDGLRRLQAHWQVKRLTSHGPVRFLVDLALPPPKKGAALTPSRLSGRSSLPEREQAAVQVEVTQGKDGHLAALVEAHRPLWELVVAIGGEEAWPPGGGGRDEPAIGGGADVSSGEGAFAGGTGVLAEVSGGGGGGKDEIDGVHTRLRGLQGSVLAEAVFDSLLGEALAHPPPGVMVVRASSVELELSLGHGKRLSLQLRRDTANGENNAKAAEARAFLMDQFVEARYGGGGVAPQRGEGGEVNSRLAVDVNESGAEAGALARLCRALQQEHAWGIIQRQVQQAVHAIPGAWTTACVPSLFCSRSSGWWLAVHVASCQVVKLLDNGTRCQIRGQAGPHHGDINAGYITAYVQDEIARFQVRQAYEAALERKLAAETRGALTFVVVAPLDDERGREEWAHLRRAISLGESSSSESISDVERAELWLAASPTSVDAGIAWNVTYKEEKKGWRGRREGLKGWDVPLEVVFEMDNLGKLVEWVQSLRNIMRADGRRKSGR